MKSKVKKTYEEVCEIIKGKGYQLLENTYINSNTKMKCIDDDGYLYEVVLTKLNMGQAPYRIHKSNKYTIDNIATYMRLNCLPCRLDNGNVYVSNSTKLNLICACGNKYFATWQDITEKSKHKCHECVKKYLHDKYAFSYEFVKKYIEDTGCKLLSKNYKSNMGKLDIVCVCGNKFKTSFANFRSGKKQMCDICGKISYATSKRKSNVEQRFSDGRYYPCNDCNLGIKNCTTCQVYRFFKRNYRDMKNTFGLSMDDIFHIINLVFDKSKHHTLNDISKIINKDMGTIIKVLDETLSIGGNKDLRVEIPCACCGKVLLRKKGEYDNDRVYCNIKCRDIVRARLFVGETHPDYKSKICKCTNCAKDIVIPPYKYNQENSFGDTHTFCSQQCYWEFRGGYYNGDKWTAEHEYTAEERQNSRARLIKMIGDGTMPQTMTKPHKIVNKMLDELNIEYVNEYPLKYQLIDIYLSNYNLMIEVMGDYWHAHPLKYEYYDDTSAIQRKSIKQDKRKHTYVKKYRDVEVLYLWEDDIIHNYELCKKIILEYVKSGGELYDYNSYNYNYTEANLALKDICFYPHFIN